MFGPHNPQNTTYNQVNPEETTKFSSNLIERRACEIKLSSVSGFKEKVWTILCSRGIKWFVLMQI